MYFIILDKYLRNIMKEQVRNITQGGSGSATYLCTPSIIPDTSVHHQDYHILRYTIKIITTWLTPSRLRDTGVHHQCNCD